MEQPGRKSDGLSGFLGESKKGAKEGAILELCAMRAARQSRRIMRPRGRIACIDWQPKKFGSAGDEPARMSSSCCSCAAAEFGRSPRHRALFPFRLPPHQSPFPKFAFVSPLCAEPPKQQKVEAERASRILTCRRPGATINQLLSTEQCGDWGISPNEQKQPARERSQSASAHLPAALVHTSMGLLLLPHIRICFDKKNIVDCITNKMMCFLNTNPTNPCPFLHSLPHWQVVNAPSIAG